MDLHKTVNWLTRPEYEKQFRDENKNLFTLTTKQIFKWKLTLFSKLIKRGK